MGLSLLAGGYLLGVGLHGKLGNQLKLKVTDSLKNSRLTGILSLRETLPLKLGLGLRLTSNLLNLGADLVSPRSKKK
jgi:hypothetical protein